MMVARMTLLSFLLAVLPSIGATECDAGDASCAVRAAALLQRNSRQEHGHGDAGPSSVLPTNGGESLYGTGGEAGVQMTPCKDESDYTPDREMWAYCDFYTQGHVVPEEATCTAIAGCYGGQGWCHCEDKTSCTAAGGFWNAHTCAMEVGMWRPEQHEILKKADELDTCIDLEVDGMRVQDMVSWPSQKCCMSYPASVCDKDLEPMTPCMHKEDFEHNKTMWAWCDGLYPAPAESECMAQGCTGNEYHCHCETEAGCRALGGEWTTYQCWQDLQYMAAEVHKGIAQAVNQSTCEDVEAYHSKLEYAVDWLGSSCCSSGMSVCQELAAGGSTYESP